MTYVYTFEPPPLPVKIIKNPCKPNASKSRKPVLSEVKFFQYLGVDLGSGPYVHI